MDVAIIYIDRASATCR